VTLASDWIERTKTYLLSGVQEEKNKLASAYTAGSGTLSFTYDLMGIQPGTRIEIGTNLLYVWEVNGKTATVTGGWEGSVDANASSGAIATVNPRFPSAQILEALNTDLVDLSSPAHGLYQVGTENLTYNPLLTGYDLDGVTDLISIIEIRGQTPGIYKDWPRVNTQKFRVMQTAPTGSNGFASGKALFIYEDMYAGYPIWVTYKKGFTALASTTTDVSTTNLPTTAYDLPSLGAAIILMSGREVKRAFTESQGDTRRAVEVPVGATTASMNGLRGLRAQRIEAEKQRLDAFYPIIKDA
jgi:hypothetical protein